jgi:DNA replication protein DnaC
MISQLKEDLRFIRLYHSSNALEECLRKSKESENGYVEFLRELINAELFGRNRTKLKKYLRNAHLPCEKSIETFDFKWQTSITKRQVKEWLCFDWIDNRHNLLLLGAPGVGKTHLAIATATEALYKGYRVRFYSMPDFVEEMILRDVNQSYKQWMKELLSYDLIVLDELGYLPVDRKYTHLFFQFINECYEYRSLIITSNKIPSQWGSYFGDESVAMAVLDRLLHHSSVIVMKGDSYRLKDKLESMGKMSD